METYKTFNINGKAVYARNYADALLLSDQINDNSPAIVPIWDHNEQGETDKWLTSLDLDAITRG